MRHGQPALNNVFKPVAQPITGLRVNMLWLSGTTQSWSGNINNEYRWKDLLSTASLVSVVHWLAMESKRQHRTFTSTFTSVILTDRYAKFAAIWSDFAIFAFVWINKMIPDCTDGVAGIGWGSQTFTSRTRDATPADHLSAWSTSFAWYSVKIRVIFGVWFERRKVDKKANLYIHENWNMQTLF